MRSLRACKSVFLVSVWLSSLLVAGASTVLLRGDRRTLSEPDTLTTFGGAATFSTSVVKPGTAITVVWLLDTFDAEQLDQARSDLVSLGRRFPARSLRLVVLRGTQAELLGPFTASVRLDRSLANIESPAAQVSGEQPAGKPGSTTALLDALIQNVESLGGQWSSVIIVGKLPETSPAIRTYATAVLTRTFTAHRLRAFVRSSSDDNEWGSFCAASGGAIFHDLADLERSIEGTGQSFLEISWTPTRPPAGFVLSPVVLTDDHSVAMLASTDIADQGATLPSIAAFAEQQSLIQEASELLHPPFSEKTLNDVRGRLTRANELNPVDPGLLRLEALFCEQTRVFGEGVKAALLLTRVRPAEGTSYSILGHLQLLASDYDEAEKALHRAAQLGIPMEQLAEDYARVHLGRGDDSGALPFLASALGLDNKRQDLWFLKAQTAQRAHQPALAMASFETGFALGGVHTPESGALIGLYLSSHQREKAHAFALHSIESMPPDPNPRAAFAQVLEDAKLLDEALAAWRSVIAVQADLELPHVRVARILLEIEDPKSAAESATNDLATFPKSGDLYLIKADALHRLGMDYDARGTLEEGASATSSVQVLARFAAVQDLYGYAAADAYGKLAETTEVGSPQHLAALERGCLVALREANQKQAEEFAARLNAEGRDDCRTLTGQGRRVGRDVVVPGGRDALAFMLNLKKGIGPDKFMAAVATAVVANSCGDNCRGNEFKQNIQKYFDTVQQIEAMGVRNQDRVLIDLSLKTKRDRKHAQEFLRLLGVDLHGQGGALKLQMGGGQNRGKKQDIMSALAVDEVGIEQALQAGKSYTVEVDDEAIALYPTAKLWQDSYPALVKSGFVLSLSQSPQVARLYAAVSGIDRRALDALSAVTHLRDLPEKSVDLLSAYGSSLAIQGTSASIPGGPRAKPMWADLVEVSPDRPGEFYRALLQASSASMLAYFYELAQLDSQHQAFVTRNVERLRRVYVLFDHMPGSQTLVRGFQRDTSLAELLQSIPLDNDGHLAFPGSPEVWSVAKGRNADSGKIAKLMKKVSRTASPDEEDAVLLRLVETRYKGKDVRHTELDNFLSVAHVDAHRTQPLDEESALLLAQRYADYWPAYAYFADIPGIDLEGFRSFFAFMDRLEPQPLLEQNLELGQLHSLLEWISILHRRNRISTDEASRLFTAVCTKLAQAEDGAARVRAALDLARSILKNCGKASASNADETLRGCLIGAGTDAAARQRSNDYAQVMDMQKVPSLAALFSVDEVLTDLLRESAAGKPFVSDAQKIVQIAAAFPDVAIPKHQAVLGKEKELILSYGPEEIQKRAGELNETAQKRKPNPKKAQKHAEEILRALEPQLTLSLAGPIYAYFLRGSDLIITEDPLLLRKHRYFDFLVEQQRRLPMQESDFMQRNESVGSYFVGGFAQFSLSSGRAAATGWRHAGSSGESMIAAQIAGIRSTPWDLLTESDQRLASLRILAAREWIVAAAQNPLALDALSERTTGILSLSRRAALLSGIEDRDWTSTWASISLPDLFTLGSNIPLKAAPFSTSPIWDELRAVSAANDGSRINNFGRIPYLALGCAHPHIVFDIPYEQYERRIPADLAQRTADLKLFLAYRADSLGIQPTEMGRVAESLASLAFEKSELTDYRDWRSLLAAYSMIEEKQFMQALQQ